MLRSRSREMAARELLLVVVYLTFCITGAVAADCPTNWKLYTNSCYLFNIHTLQTPLLTWEESRADCLGYGGDLTSILDDGESNFIYSQTKNLGNFLFWIGLYRNTTTNDPKQGWIWSDGNNFTNPKQWYYGEPNNFGNNENCAEVYGRLKKWNDNDCNKKFGSICKRDKDKPFPTLSANATVPPTTGKPPSCDYGWEAYGNSCYKFPYKWANWGDAQKACRDTGGHLVTISDNAEQNYFTFKLRKSYQSYWIGLNSLEVDGRWVWESASRKHVKYTNWQSGEPNSHQGKERCVEMLGHANAGFWNDASCAGRKKFICEKENGLNMCPDNWKPYNDSCYQFNLGSSQEMTWSDAERACNATAGLTTLVTITNQDEQNFITKNVKNSEVWIGLQDGETETIFKWSDGSLLTDTEFSIWANVKPTENKPNKDCVTLLGMRSDGAWSVQDCDLKRKFVCKRHRDLVFCNTPIGMENGNIPDNQITASSSQSSANGPEKARYRHSGSWCPATNDKNPFIQVDIGSIYNIKNVIVDDNLTYFAIRYSSNGKQFQNYPGTVSTRTTLNSFKARVVQVYPRAWKAGLKCFTMELVGCVAQFDKKDDCTGKNWERGPGNLCYQINRNYRTWTDARSMCLDQQGDLLTIRNDKEKAALTTRIKTVIGVSSFWISLNDRDYMDFMYWSNNDPNAVFVWGSGDPPRTGIDKYNLKSCVEMSSSTGRWTNIGCDQRRPYICMKRIFDRHSSLGDVVKYGPTGVWISTAQYYWPLSSIQLGTRPGKAYGTMKSVTGIRNKPNTALQFSSSGSYIDVGSFGKECITYPEACSNGLTISFMASFDTTAVNWLTRGNIFDSVGDETQSVGIVVYVTNQQLWFVVSKAYKIFKSSITIIGDKTWRHYVLRFNETGMFISVNGKSLTISTSIKTMSTFREDKQSNLFIGLRSTTSITSGQINLAMVAFWNLILSDNDVNSIYNTEFGHCPFGWSEFGMSCYQFNRDSKSNDQARLQCQSAGGDLVSIESSVEQSFLSQQVTANSWIAHHDKGLEGVFVQTNNDVLKYSNWNLWEPNNYGRLEDCTEILKVTGLWNDLSCYYSRPYICEKTKDMKLLNTSVVSIPKFKRVCQYSHATIGCPSGMVIKINSAFWGRLKRDICIRISVTNCGKTEIPETTKKVQGFCDNTPMCTLNAIESVLGDQCKSVTKYLEVNYTCVTESTTTKCPAGWKLSRDNNMCYGLFATPKTWQDAKTACESVNSKLVSISNSDEQSQLTSLMERTWYSDVWTGLNDLKTKGEYQWSDGSSVTWTNWYAGQPDERRTDKSCVYMSLKRIKRTWMFWRDENCTKSLPYMCKKTLSNQQKPKTTPAVFTGACLPGWNSNSNLQYCYLPVNNRKSWPEAQKYCKELSVGFADLISINSKNENTFVRKLSNSTIWIGLESRGVFRGHVWSDGNPVSYTNWDIGQPDSFNGLEACVELNPDTEYWSDVSCYTRNEFVCKRQKAKTPATTPSPTVYPSPGSSYCRQGWTLFNGMCYIVGNDSASDIITWYEAETRCKIMRGHLASINSEAEQSFLTYLIKDKKSVYYSIGLNDIGSESYYKWNDGSPYGKYLNWNTNEPNDFQHQEDCVHVRKVDSKWNDNHCGLKTSYICKSYNETYHPAITIGPAIPKDGYCPPGWVVNGQWCYEFHTETGDYKTWSEAKNACEKGTNSSSFGELASIGDQFEEAFLTINIKGSSLPLWIGMNNFYTYRVFRWLDNSPSNYFKWNTREPYSYGRRCVEIVPYRWAAGRWNSVPCAKKQGYVCKKAASTTPIKPITLPYTPTPTEAPRFTCPKSYKVYGDSCFKFVRNTPKTFDEARKTCKNENADLMSIDSQFKQAYLVYLLERYIGSVWIGLLHEPYSTFRLTDHTSPMFTYWGSGQPNRHLGQRSCTQANITGSTFGNWDDVDCGLKNPFVCQIYQGEPKVTNPINSTCPQGWRKYDKFCYKHFNQYKTWSQAKYACNILGSDLLSIHDDREQDFLIYFYQDKHPFNVWIGLNDRDVEQGFKWSDNSPLNYINWNNNEPNDYTSNENCVEMWSRNGVWNDISCSRRFQYICKHKLECSSVLQIDPSMITVTESSNASLGANQAIIQDDNSNDLAWCTNNTSGNAKIKIDFGRLVRIRKIGIQGRNTPIPRFVKSFRIDYDKNDIWQPYIGWGGHTITYGNTDGVNIVQRLLKPSIDVNSISITPLTWSYGDQICMKIRLYGCNYVCQGNLIKAPGKLDDDTITASSAKYPKNIPKQAAARGNGWCAKTNDKNQWVQANFNSEMFISRIRTFGDKKESYVKSYKLQFSADGKTWIDYQQYGKVRIFKGNVDADRPINHALSNSIEASYIRFVPLSWNKNICMRFQLLGCHADCDKALLDNGQENNEIKMSSSAGEESNPKYAVFSSGKAWCTNKKPLTEQYLQIDFPQRMRVMKIATQGSPQNYGKPRQVSTFVVSIAPLTTWKYIVEKVSKQPKKYIGINQKDPNKPMINRFKDRGIPANKMRIYPRDFNGDEICMRVEVYGCIAGSEILPTDQPEKQKIIDVALRITSLEWNDKLKDKKSEEFANANKKIIKAVGDVYEQESMSYRSVKVKEMKKGSVIAVLELVFDASFSENITKPLLEAVKKGKVGSLEVDKTYFKVIETNAQAQSGGKPSALSSGAVAGIVITVLLLFVAAVAGGFLFYRQKKRKNLFSPQHFDNPISFSSKAYDMDD